MNYSVPPTPATVARRKARMAARKAIEAALAAGVSMESMHDLLNEIERERK